MYRSLHRGFRHSCSTRPHRTRSDRYVDAATTFPILLLDMSEQQPEPQTESTNGNSTRLITSRFTLAYLVFVFYGSWVPLKFHYMPLTDAWLAFRSLPFFEQSIQSATDWATNFLLLIPLTFLLAQRILSPHKRTARLVLRLLIVGFGVFIACTLGVQPAVLSATDRVAERHPCPEPRGDSWRDRPVPLGQSSRKLVAGHLAEESRQARVVRMLHAYLAILLFQPAPP